MHGNAEFVEKRRGGHTALYRFTIHGRTVIVVFDRRYRRILSVLYDLDKDSPAYKKGLCDAEHLGYEDNQYEEDTQEYWNYTHGFWNYRKKELTC